MRPFPLALAALLAFGPGGAWAATYTSFWAFGDSLTDPGNLFAATGGALPPSPPYHEGRASDGPVWAEAVAGDFARRGFATGNFAFAGAGALPDADGIPDLPDQVAFFDAVPDGLLGARPVAALWFGANDLFDVIASGDPVAVAARATAAARAVLDGIEGLATLGVGDFVVFNQPPLELTPRFALFRPDAAPLADLGAETFNSTLLAGLGGLDDGLGVSLIDIDAALTGLIADPGAFGLSDATLPCYVQGRPAATRCSDAEAAQKVFFDAIHPTAAVHAAIADLARAEIAPVPLPPAGAAMGVGLLGLLAAGRRKQGASGPL